MHQYLLKIPLPWGGVFRLPSYGFMILCGFLVCLWLFQRRGRRVGLNPAALFDIALISLLCGIVGARIFFVIYDWSDFAGQPWRVLYVWQGGLVFFGGLVGGLAGMIVSIRVRGLPVWTTLDVAGSLMPLAHAFGRTGCFLNGCCFGKVTSSWVGVAFPRVLDESGAVAGCPVFSHHLGQGLVTASQTHSLPVHPTQLYAVAYNLAIFGALSLLLPRRRRPGDVGWFYIVLYCTARFTNELFRGDTGPVAWLGGLTIFQGIALAGVALGLVMLVRSFRLPPEPAPSQAPARGS